MKKNELYESIMKGVRKDLHKILAEGEAAAANKPALNEPKNPAANNAPAKKAPAKKEGSAFGCVEFKVAEAIADKNFGALAKIGKQEVDMAKVAKFLELAAE